MVVQVSVFVGEEREGLLREEPFLAVGFKWNRKGCLVGSVG